jgi:hypothetical protein
METPHVLILHSIDEHVFDRAILYPAGWSARKAEKLAADVMAKVAKQTEEWSWDDFEKPLTDVGFTITNWTNATEYWDDQVGPEVKSA